ncbi:unnamed protein product [Somion occarium]|uniref:Uncharacterized protein n=1 Tax=Somion occarium TaxID=3059160 RepID=A0ABP1DFR7_9APHY
MAFVTSTSRMKVTYKRRHWNSFTTAIKCHKKRAPDESDDKLEEAGTSDVGMEDVKTPAQLGKRRKSDMIENEPKQQSRAERLSARTAAKRRSLTQEKNGKGKKADTDPSSNG